MYHFLISSQIYWAQEPGPVQAALGLKIEGVGKMYKTQLPNPFLLGMEQFSQKMNVGIGSSKPARVRAHLKKKREREREIYCTAW